MNEPETRPSDVAAEELEDRRPSDPGVQPGPTEEGLAVATRSQRRMIVRRFLQHRLAVISLVILVLLIVGSLVGGRLWRYGYAEQLPEFNQSPSWGHPMGIDAIGRDLLAKVLRGAQRSVQVALLVALLSTTIGTIVGAVAGYYRGVLDAVLMRVTDLFLVVPQLAVFLLLARIVGGGWFQLSLIIAAFFWMPIARIVRAEFLSLRETEYVDAARALGAGDLRIILRHLIPNAIGSIIVNASIVVAVAILAETSLSYLGLGIAAPDTSLGLLVSEGQSAFETRPYLFYFPGLLIVLIALTVNFVGDGLRDAFDPKQSRARR
ncbi:MAG: ABC transporter permease [Acidimicrobiales bacterium]|nr:ABC transporter permease [Acidimicrobiales bacterium]